jgi:hypothetical protein
MKLARVELVYYPPGARCCSECLNGKAIYRNVHVMKCGVDGSLTFRDFPGHCEFFSENKRGAKRRKAQARKFGP